MGVYNEKDCEKDSKGISRVVFKVKEIIEKESE
jgi:hypothetical protein